MSISSPTQRGLSRRRERLDCIRTSDTGRGGGRTSRGIDVGDREDLVFLGLESGFCLGGRDGGTDLGLDLVDVGTIRLEACAVRLDGATSERWTDHSAKLSPK